MNSVNKHHGHRPSNDKVLHLFPIPPSPHIPVGGRLKYFKSEWYKLTKDPELISMISACPIHLIAHPPNYRSGALSLTCLERKAARDHIRSLLTKKAIVRSTASENDFISSVFLVPKKDGGFRMILNLKEFNKYAQKIHFKMETLQHILYLVSEDCFMTGIDLIDAFLTVPMDLSSCQLFKFRFEGQVYMYICLPFGFTDSPRVFTKILKPVIAKLRSQGHTVTFYLDDGWQCNTSYKSALDTCLATYTLLLKVGFLPNIKKSQLVPSKCIQILGTYVDSHKMLVSLPKSKEQSILRLIANTIQSRFISIRDLARVIGKLLSCLVACPFGQMHYRHLERLKIRALRLHHGRWNSRCKLTTKALSDLLWWQENLPNTCAPICRKSPGPVVFTDACITGWGCFYNGQYANGHFSQLEQPLSINTKETLAILYGVRSFINELKHHNTILVLSDSTTAISYIRKMGGMQSELRSKIATDLWTLIQQHNMWLVISHIPGILNTESDWASRTLSERTEWMLNPPLFRHICKHFGVHPSIDLFASRLNNQLPHYYSFGPDPYSSWVDAFTIKWDKNTCYYLFPPFNLIHRALAKINHDKTPQVLAVLPDWPNQPWYPMTSKMCHGSTPPFYLPLSSSTLTLPWNYSTSHPNLNNLKLRSLVLSGINTHQPATHSL